MEVQVGDRVIVHPDSGWNEGARTSLEGMIGKVAKTSGMLRRDAADARPILVELDERPKPWHANQIPSRGWWFHAGELEIVP